ncbi:MAG: LLM class flavin-dependent oxidoreductase, partial [Gammaproteobacteria bacterium]|nr:LLM class flavin-dependent oxidoreductase [Gammaproteobacteria bacterium]
MTIGIGMGLGRFSLDRGPDYFKWIQQCEQGSVDSIWQTDRLISKEPNLETLSTMAAIAGSTDSMRFGMNVASIALRDPLLTAKQCATIDFLSGGRLLPAFGIGSALSRDYTATG